MSALVAKSTDDQIMVIADVVNAISSAIKKENPKFNESEFYDRIIPERHARMHAMIMISRIAQEEHRNMSVISGPPSTENSDIKQNERTAYVSMSEKRRAEWLKEQSSKNENQG